MKSNADNNIISRERKSMRIRIATANVLVRTAVTTHHYIRSLLRGAQWQ